MTIAKFKAIIITALIIIIEIGLLGCLNNRFLDIEYSLKLASFICVAGFCVEFVVWYRLTKEIFSPYTVFFVVLFAFCCGQSIGWLFGIDMGMKDMWDRVDHNMSKTLLLSGLTYSMIGISCFHLGAIIGTKCDRSNNMISIGTEIEVTKAFNRISRLLLIICIPAFIANTVVSIGIVVQGGYASIYTFQKSSSIIMRILEILANYYQPCLLLLLIVHRKNKKKRNLIVMAMLIDVVINLFIGGRSGAVMSLLAIVLSYHYFVRRFRLKEALLGGIGGYLGVVVLNAVADIRDVANKSLYDFFPALVSSFSNVIGDFIGELGWSITSICWTMDIVPTNYPFRYGMSYLVSLISWIPSFFFQGIHPVVTWGELSNWLQNSLSMTYGPGYTMIAEAYINFGQWGYIALIIEGIIIGLIIAAVPRVNAERNLLKSTMQIMFIMVLMKSIVRSSVSIAFKNYFFVILPLYIIIRISLKKTGNPDIEQ